MSKSSKSRPKGSPNRFPEEHSEPQGAIWCPGGYNNNGQAPQRPTKAEKYEKPIVKLMLLRKNIKFLK